MGHYIRGPKWRNPIPYKLGWRIRENLTLASTIQTAINTYERQTNARFIPRTNEDEYISFVAKGKGGHLKKARTGGNSDIGRGEGEDGRVHCRLAPDAALPVVLHEIGHALGLKHEQQRRDRNDYVTIYWKNVKNKKKKDNFRMTGKGDGRRVGSYDYVSIMHYGRDFYAKEGTDTMLAKDGTTTIGGTSLTSTDIQTINKIIH